MAGKTLCLCMIVRNESRVIRRCLDSVRDIIDTWVIVDTGSTDDTMQIIERELANIPGELHQRPWEGFGRSRTQYMKLARGKADYILVMDADEVLVVDPAFRKDDLALDSYRVRYTGNLDYAYTVVFRADLDWRYVGPAHEYPTSDQARTSAQLDTLTLDHRHDGGMRHVKYERGIRLLEEGFEEDPTNARYAFYIAQNLKDIDRHEEALEWYRRRASMAGFDEEVFYSLFQIGRMLEFLGRRDEARTAYVEAWEFRPSRAEPLHNLASLYRRTRRYEQAYRFARMAREIPYPSRDILFVHRDIYEYKILDELCVSAWWSGHREEGREAALELEHRLDRVPAADRPRIEKNLGYYLGDGAPGIILPEPGRPVRVALLTARPNPDCRVDDQTFSCGEKRPPNGIGFLHSVLRAGGIDAEVYDRFSGDDRWPDDDFASAEMVGIYCASVCTEDIAHIIERVRAGRIVVGGPHAHLHPDWFPERVTHIVRGEGEAVIADLVRDPDRFDRVVEPDRLTDDDLDALPRFPFDYFYTGARRRLYGQGFPFSAEGVFPVYTMNTSRGCPFECSFCAVRRIWGRKYTLMSAERVFDDMCHVRAMGARSVYFREDNFTVNRRRVEELCRKLVGLDSGLSWVCETRVDTVDDELMELMKRAGCIGFYVGVEHLSQHMLDVFNKKYSVDRILHFFEQTRRLGLRTAASFIKDHPEETTADVAERERLMSELRPTVIWMNPFRPGG